MYRQGSEAICCNGGDDDDDGVYTVSANFT